MLTPILVVGAGGHAHVVLDALSELGYHVAAVMDDCAREARAWGYDLLSETELGRLRREGVGCAVVALGDNWRRAQWISRLRAQGFALPNIFHPRASVSREASLCGGVVVCAGAVVCTGAVIGRGALVNTLASVDHDCVVGAYAQVAPHAAMCGRSRLGAFALLGAGAVVLPGVRVGAHSVMGAGALAVKDIEGGCVAVGIPARVTRRREKTP